MKYQTCSRGGSFNNFMSALPRLNVALKGISNNLAVYDLFWCPRNETRCGLGELEVADVGSFAVNAVTGRLGGRPENAADPKNYVQALALYYYVGLTLALLSLLISIATLVWLCLRKGLQSTSCFQRAASWSRPSSRRQSSKNANSIPELPKFDLARSKKRRRWASLLLGLYALATVCFILVGVFKGALSMAPAAHNALIRSPTKLARIVQNLNPPLQTFLTASGATISDTLRQVNQSIVSNVDLEALKGDVECAERGQLKLPRNGTLEVVLSAVQATYDQIPDAQTVTLQLATAQEEVTNLSRVLPPLSTSLQALASTRIEQALLSVESGMFKLNQSMDALISGPDSLDSSQSTFLEALLAADVLVDGDGTGGLIGQLQGLPLKGCPTCTGGAQYRQSLLAALSDFRGSLLNLSTFSPELETTVEALGSLPDLRALASDMRRLDDALVGLPSFSQLAANLTLLDGALAADGLPGLYASMNLILNAPETVQSAVGTISDMSGNLTQLNTAIDTYGPCVRSIRQQLYVVNTTLVRLPHTLDGLRAQLQLVRTNALNLPDFLAIQGSLQSFLLQVQFVLPVIRGYQGPFARTVNLTDQLTGDFALANLTNQASALARKSWSLALQAAQVNALAPAVVQLNASAWQLQELLNRISDAKAPLLTALKIALSVPPDGPSALLSAGPQLVQAVSFFRAAAENVTTTTLPDFAALAPRIQPLQGLSEHVQDLQGYRANIEVFAKPELSNLLIDLSGALQNLPNLADVSSLWGQLSFDAPAAPLNLTSALTAARKVGAQRLMSAENFTTVYEYLARANELLYGAGDDLLTQLEPASVNASLTANGTEAAANGMLDAVNQVYSLATGANSSTGPLGSAELRSGLKIVGRIADSGNGSADAMAYLASVTDLANSNVSSGTNGSREGFFTFTHASCLTDDCLSNSIELLFKGALADATRVLFGTGAFSAWKLSLQGTLVMAYTMPAVLASLAVLSSSILARRWLAITVAVSVMVTSPFALLISGALEAPVGLLAADVCGSFASLTVKLLDTTAPDYRMSLSNQTVVVSPSLLAASVFDGDCSLANDVAAVWQNVSKAVVPYVPAMTASWLGSPDISQGFEAGQKLQAIVREGSAEVSALLQQLIQSGQSAASCQRVHEAYLDVHEAFCCDVVESVQWYLGSWYIIALLMLLVGTPASLLAAVYCPRWKDLLAVPRNPEEVDGHTGPPGGSLEGPPGHGSAVESRSGPVRAPSTLLPVSERVAIQAGDRSIPEEAQDRVNHDRTTLENAARIHMKERQGLGYVPWTATWASAKPQNPLSEAGGSRRASQSGGVNVGGNYILPDSGETGLGVGGFGANSHQDESRLMEAPLVASRGGNQVEADGDNTIELESTKTRRSSDSRPSLTTRPKSSIFSRNQVWGALARAGQWRQNENH